MGSGCSGSTNVHYCPALHPGLTTPRKVTPAEEARLAQARRQFQERKRIADSLKSIGKRIGVYSGKGGVGKTTVAG